MINIGDRINHNFIISEDIYNGFINTFKDKNPMHVDSEFSKKYGYNDVLMHGNILNGFLSYFIGEKLPLKNVVILSQNINYNNPVYLNDILKISAIVYEIHESVNVIYFKYKFINQKQVLVAKGTIQIRVLE
jgi:3-hydroxybutyryl-CoA dehydratase